MAPFLVRSCPRGALLIKAAGGMRLAPLPTSTCTIAGLPTHAKRSQDFVRIAKARGSDLQRCPACPAVKFSISGAVVMFMPRKRRRPEYPGEFGEYGNELLKPIVIEKPPLIDEDKFTSYKTKELKRIRNLMIRKIQLLCVHFEIDWNDPDKWGKLSLFLAFAHVPGMQIVDKSRGGGAPPGPRKKLRNQYPSLLVCEVNKIKNERGEGIVDAIGVLKRRNVQKYREYSEGAIKARYYRELRILKKYALSLTALDKLTDTES
jgi:hypothetical protein